MEAVQAETFLKEYFVKTIGERIVYLREKLGISQKDLAKQLGITAASLSRYENNLYDPKSAIITSLSQVLHTSSDFLLGINSDIQYSTRPSPVNETDLHIWELYRLLTPEDKIRIEERILTLYELHNVQSGPKQNKSESLKQP